MGISRDTRHKRRATGGKRKAYRKKRKFEMGRPPANTKIGEKRIHLVRARGGAIKHRALRLETGNFAWGSETVARKSRIFGVVYNASNNELVRTNTLVKNCIIQVDATPFRLYYEQFYGTSIGKKRKSKTGKKDGKSGKKSTTKDDKSKVKSVKGGKAPAKDAAKSGKPAAKDAAKGKAAAPAKDAKAKGKAAAPAKDAKAKKAAAPAKDAKSGKPAAKDAAKGKAAAPAKDAKAKKVAAPAKDAKAKKVAAPAKDAKDAKGKAAAPAKDAKAAVEPSKDAKEAKEVEKPKKKKGPSARDLKAKKKLLALKKLQTERRKTAKVAENLVEQFITGRLLVCVSSRPGQSGRCDGYVLEGKELDFYQRKIAQKKKAK